MNDILDFYNKNPFPGPYTLEQLTNYDVTINRYVNIIDKYLTKGQRVLDIGCGTGMLTNLFALRYASKFVGVDFSVGADYARKFAQDNLMLNASFVKQDFFEYDSIAKFDVIIAQSFITHVPNYQEAIDKIMSHLKPSGILILGVYNNWGNKVKQLTNVNFGNSRLELDQTQHPCEIVLSHKQVLGLFRDCETIEVTPSIANRLVGPANLFNARNGGLTMYVLKGSDYVDIT